MIVTLRRVVLTLVLAPALLVGVGACVSSPPTVPTVRLDPMRVPPPGGEPLAAVAFFAGCWRSAPAGGGAALEERWSPPEGGTMLSTSRFVREGRVVSFEFGIVRATAAGVSYLPHPGGVASEHTFLLTAVGPGEALFEAPEHDYPRRIRYRATDDGLEATIDGGESDPSPRTWRMNAIPCGK